jgi:nucleoside phosphorylase
MQSPSDTPAQTATRTIDLADVLLDVSAQLGLDEIDAYLFGSRRHRRGGPATDIDVLLFFDGAITDSDSQAIWHAEPYLNIYHGRGGTARSIVNESVFACCDQAALIDDLDAVPLYLRGQWQPESDEWRRQEVLAGVNPATANASLFSSTNAPPGDRADVLAIMALPHEYRAAITELGVIPQSERSRVEVTANDGRTLIVELILVSSMGSVQAALETYDSLRRTKASHVVLLGIAAGIPSELGLGDVIIPEQIYYYEPAKITNDGEIGGPIWKSTNSDVRRAASVFAEIAKGNWAVNISTGTILASGEKVVASEEFRNKVRRAHRRLAAIDMESYGVACAAERFNSNFTVIKGISDFADSLKGYEYHVLAAGNSAKVFHFLLRKGAFNPRASE